MTELLKLIAMDKDDLNVISAHTQDAIIKSSDIEFFPTENLIALPMNRFVWEAPSARRWIFKKYERRKSMLHFSTVRSIKSRGVNRENESQILSLLSVTFSAASDHDDPSGTIDLTFAGDAALLLEVECIEAQLTDLSAAWSTLNKPRHGRK